VRHHRERLGASGAVTGGVVFVAPNFAE